MAINTTEFYNSLFTEPSTDIVDETEEERKKREEEERVLAEQRRLKEMQETADAEKLITEQVQEQEAVDKVEKEILPTPKSKENLYAFMSEDYDETLDYSKIDDSISTTRQLQFGARQEKTIVGNLVGTWSELYELMELADRGKVKLSMQEYKLDDANKALHDLNEGKVKGRAVLVP